MGYLFDDDDGLSLSVDSMAVVGMSRYCSDNECWCEAGCRSAAVVVFIIFSDASAMLSTII